MKEIETVQDKNTVRVVFTNPVCQRHPYTIPIIKLTDDTFVTGQDLSKPKMLGEEPLSIEEKKQYPFVINPLKYYKVNHRQILERGKGWDDAMIKLLVLGGEIAPSLAEYNKNRGRYKGYIEDYLAEAVESNELADKQFEAETAVRNLPISEYQRVARIVNFRMGVHINADTMPTDYVKAKLIEACRKDPDSVKMCFAQFNPGVDMDSYILELIHYKILSKKPDGSIFDGGIYIATGLDGVKNFMNKSSNAPSIDKWKKQLDIKKGIAEPEPVYKVNVDLESEEAGYKKTLDACKAAIVDENIAMIEFNFNILENKFAKFFEESQKEKILDKLNELKAQQMRKPIHENENKFKSELESKPIEKLQASISHHSSKYNPDDCKDIWDDKEKLIEYMVKVKFSE